MSLTLVSIQWKVSCISQHEALKSSVFRVIAAYLGWEALDIVTVNLRHHSFSNIDDLGAKVFEMGLTVYR